MQMYFILLWRQCLKSYGIYGTTGLNAVVLRYIFSLRMKFAPCLFWGHLEAILYYLCIYYICFKWLSNLYTISYICIKISIKTWFIQQSKLNITYHCSVSLTPSWLIVNWISYYKLQWNVNKAWGFPYSCIWKCRLQMYFILPWR